MFANEPSEGLGERQMLREKKKSRKTWGCG